MSRGGNGNSRARATVSRECNSHSGQRARRERTGRGRRTSWRRTARSSPASRDHTRETSWKGFVRIESTVRLRARVGMNHTRRFILVVTFSCDETKKAQLHHHFGILPRGAPLTCPVPPATPRPDANRRASRVDVALRGRTRRDATDATRRAPRRETHDRADGCENTSGSRFPSE